MGEGDFRLLNSYDTYCSLIGHGRLANVRTYVFNQIIYMLFNLLC
jgi:hypothetical protein